jgi:hypothetical protein
VNCAAFGRKIMTLSRNTVPCNGCGACCRKETVVLSAENGDDYAQYRVEEIRTGDGKKAWALWHKPDGSCIYLTPTGCSIHVTAPWACRTFDCRAWFLKEPAAMQELLLVDDVYGDIAKAAKARL